MNSLAAVCITDFIRPAYFILKDKPIDERYATFITKSLGNINLSQKLKQKYQPNNLDHKIIQIVLLI